MEISKSFGAPATLVIAAITGAAIGQVASKKISMLNTTLGRLAMVGAGVVGVAYAKSDAVKGLSLGIAVSGATGLIGNIAGSINGFDGLSGVGEVVQDPATGMMYVVNGVGELEYLPQDGMVYGAPDEMAFAGVGETDYAAV
ncbi:MAG: hypothetical protein HGA42_00620 [Nostocales cyanobacterium W4_Combined_metabat2_030]|nr:hypothetical protein [Nostocales cyanobacterium W4_Combined_metabat2_030]